MPDDTPILDIAPDQMRAEIAELNRRWAHTGWCAKPMPVNDPDAPEPTAPLTMVEDRNG